MAEAEELFSALVEKSGLSLEEVSKRLEEKKEILGHLINDDVAIRLVARDLGVELRQSKAPELKVSIEDLVPNMNNVNLVLTVDEMGVIKEFTKKDGTIGKVARVSVCDKSGKLWLVMWDEKTEYIKLIGVGIKISVLSAYTKAGLRGGVELHIGNRGRLEVMEQTDSPSIDGVKDACSWNGRVWKVYDPIEFKRKDGGVGRAFSFQIKVSSGLRRILVWNPSDELILNIVDGIAIEIYGGIEKNGFNGISEIHINDERSIRLNKEDIAVVAYDVVRLSKVQPGMTDITIEGTIEMDFDVETTNSGKNVARVLLRDGETVIPLTFWNEKAFTIKKIAKVGSSIRVDGCYSKIGRLGLEIGVNRWSKIIEVGAPVENKKT